MEEDSIVMNVNRIVMNVNRIGEVTLCNGMKI